MIKSFKMPKAVNIMGRSSSITNSFINGIIPVIKPSDEEIIESLNLLELTPENVTCIYCGDKMTEWDHLNPLIIDKKATGYISEIKNLVPACGKCNQSKGNSYWRDWIMSNADLSPKTKGVKDLKRRISILEKYEKWGNLKPYDFEGIVGKELWNEHWNNYLKIINEMNNSTLIMKEIKNLLSGEISGKREHNLDRITMKSMIISEKRNLNHMNSEAIEINKVKRKIPGWFSKQFNINSKILIRFCKMYTQNGNVSIYDLEEKCSDIKTYKSNYNQMKNFGEKNHAKVFSEANNIITLWQPVKDFIFDEYNKYNQNKI